MSRVLSRRVALPKMSRFGWLMGLYSENHARLQRLFEAAIANGELPATLDVDAAAILLVGTVQGLVVQSLLAGDVERMRHDAPRVFAIYRRGIGGAA